ncbi:TPA: hypothetical protein N0F65_006394 [Lagenidium giganteum]|uniref:Uncharacterized protein n=1 Tax=Lagenidium giganteum TaxID=4803 RepID=A0AAV2YNK4_9STRA|nr:TPA: hypothetical protein N0F65_006394 [Lagenidium giganteum]
MSRHRTPVFTQQLYESSLIGDEAGLCPLLPNTVELLLGTDLPTCLRRVHS